MKPLTGLIRAAGVALAVLLLTVASPAQTTQDFANPGTPYGATKIGTSNGPVTMAPGPGGVGNFLRLLSSVGTPGTNTIVFDRTDKGAFTQMVADFDFRMNPVTGQGEGMGFALLDTAAYDKFGAVSGPAEEPNFSRSLGIGFDIHQDGGELNANHVSVHFNNVKLTEVDAGSIALAGNQWIHANIVVRPGDGNSDVSVTLTPFGGIAVKVIDGYVVSGLEPYESRAYFAARMSASNTADHDLANVQVTYTAKPSVLGKWSGLMTLPIVAIHSTLLPNGKVICWDRNVTADIIPRLIDTATLDNPPDSLNINVTSAAAPPGVPIPLEIFCSGHTLLADGRLFVAGGHNVNDGEGLDTALIYDSFADSWTQLPNMGTGGRWYPTVTLLPNGDPIVFSGEMTGPGFNPKVQVWQFGVPGWKTVGPDHTMPCFPYMHVVPGGKIFHTGPETGSEFLDPATGIWTAGPARKTGYCDYGGSVLYDTGKILVLGGGSPQATAEVIDLSVAPLAWRKLTASMAYPRRQASSLLLPDGTVLITGGTSYPGFNNVDGSVFPAEIWDPGTEKFRTVAGANHQRVYHSETLLLPDGRVLSLGSGHPDIPAGFNCEVYSPPYLFKGPRPALTAAPSKVLYGQVFPVTSVDAASVTSVSMIAASSVTHTNNFTQRMVRPSFTLGANTVSITTPSDPTVCPPGLYLLFLLNNGVPSPGKMVIVGYNQPPVAAVAGNITAEATKAAGADVQFDGTSSTDPDNNLTTYEWLEGMNLLATGATPSVTLGVGVHTITLRVTDAGSLTNTTTFTVTIQDTTAPLFQTLTATPQLLRSVSGALLPISLLATVTDDVDPSPTLQAFNVTSSEATSLLAIPGGDQTPDWQLPGGLSVNLRAERYAILRRYTIDARATDAKGNQSNTKSVDVRVRGKWFP